MKFISVLFLILPCFAQAAFSLESAFQHKDARPLLDEVERTIPGPIKEVINKKVSVSFKRLHVGDRKIWGAVLAVPLMKKNASHIDLNVELLNEENAAKFKATLIHELMHIYDFQKNISSDPVFLNVTGWQKKKITRTLEQRNTNQLRRVDVYEDKNPEESFAVNMEHFLQDSSFKCRKPSLYQYLSKKINFKPFADIECETEYFLPATVGLDGKVERQKSIDPSRLYEVHYFFAGQGKEAMSRFGHAMLRLVMCAPHRKEVDEKCLQDRAYHLVISFRADITNFNIDYVKGLTGKYTSKMFILNMSDVIREYTVGELRHLYSIPLKMNEDQKKALAAQVLENYWGYGSKYYFVTNNCADETLNILKNVYDEDFRMVDMNVLTPLGIRKKFESMGISDMTVFDNLDEAKKKGYYFESLHAKLGRIFKDLIDAGVLPETASDYELFLTTSTLEQRKHILETVESSDILGKLLFIEDVILNKGLLDFQKKIGKTLFEQDKNGGSLVESYRAIEKYKENKSGVNIEKGYGIPQKSDMVFTQKIMSAEEEAGLKESQVEFMAQLEKLFGKEQKVLTEIALNKQAILKQMNKKKIP